MAQRTLSMPKEEASRLLKNQIKEGENLLSRAITTEAELREYVLDRKRYNQFNLQILDQMFGERNTDLFWHFGLSFPPESDELDARVNFYKRLDSEQVNELRSYEESLDLIPKAQNAFQGKTKKRWRPATKIELIGLLVAILSLLITVVALLVSADFRRAVGLQPTTTSEPSSQSAP